MTPIGDILVLPFFGQGHLNPFVELCKHLASHSQSKIIFIIPSHLSSSIPSTIHENKYPSIQLLLVDASYSHLPEEIENEGRRRLGHAQMGKGIESFLAMYKIEPGRRRPGFVVMGLMMSWSKDIFFKEKVPVVSFSTSGAGAGAGAIECAAWEAHSHDIKPGETRVLPGLPETVAFVIRTLEGGSTEVRPVLVNKTVVVWIKAYATRVSVHGV